MGDGGAFVQLEEHSRIGFSGLICNAPEAAEGFMMLKLICVFSLFMLVACQQATQEPQAQRGTSAEPVDEPAAIAAVEPDIVSGADLLRICKAGMSAATGANVSVMDARATAADIAQISYTRTSDGKSFRYDCKLEGNVIRTRMIDEGGPGTGPGIWSGRGSTATFALEPGVVVVRTRFFDGSEDEDRIEI